MAGRVQRQRLTFRRFWLPAAGLLLSAAGFAQTFPPSGPAPAANPLDATSQAIVQNVSVDSLRKNLTFLASDELEGRGTPSAGLNTAADYIASYFAELGLEPAIGDSYFQTVTIAELGRQGARLQAAVDAGAPDFMRNVAGILRGSDPALRDSYVIVSAHYDHVGIAGDGPDRIFNGANDDASGTSSVMEIAHALTSLKKAPRRSILFLLFFGEEKGLLGSRYYGEHPIVPLKNTVAEINLEHMGRTDMDGGLLERTANVTGFDFSSLTDTIVSASRDAGITIVKNEQYSDPFFNQSDNRSLALAGIPAHTISVGYLFPDYHKPSDHADKIDFENMAAVDRGVALAVWRLANSNQAPEWNATLPAAAQYRDAASQLRPVE